MADNSENVVENVSEEKADGHQQMLPPPPPVSTKNKGKKADASKKAEKSAISFKEGAEITHSKPMSVSEIAPSKLEEGQTNTTESNKEHQHVTSSLVKGKQEEEKQDDEASRNKNSEKSMLPPKLPSVADKKIGKTEQNTKDTDKKDYPDVPYTEPSWAGIPQEPYHLELLKGGCIISTKRLTSKSYYLFGRLPNCDMVMEHPSISRYHAIIQYKANDSTTGKKGFYLYDLGSTHGTKVNKIAIHPKRYYRLQVGYVIKFGGSSRLYILQVHKYKDIKMHAIQFSYKRTFLVSSAGISLFHLLIKFGFPVEKPRKRVNCIALGPFSY